MEDGEEEEEGHWEDWEIAGKSVTNIPIIQAGCGGWGCKFSGINNVYPTVRGGGGAMEIAGSEQVYPLACG